MTEKTIKLIPEDILGAYTDRDFAVLRSLFRDNEIADIAEVFSSLEFSECVGLFRLISRTRRHVLFSHFPFELQEAFLLELPQVLVSSLLNEMEPDDRTRLLEDLSDEMRQKLLAKLEPSERKVASKLLSYPENSVGRLMTPYAMTLDSGMKVSDALHFIHWNTSLPTEYLTNLFITDSNAKFVGEVSLATLVVCDPPSKLVSEIMQKTRVALTPTQNDEEAIEIFRKYDRNYMPVVDEDFKILGLVSADDVFDLAEEAATKDIQQFGAHDPLEGSYLNTSVLTMLKKRAGWLAFLFVSGFVSGQAIRSFEDALTKWSFLMFFIPIINSAGGNSGTQAASLIIRGIVINELSPKDALRVLRKELLVALLLGIILAVLGYSLVYSWGLGHLVGGIVFISVVSVVVCGVFVGSMLPFFFHRIKLDPAVVSSPFITTIIDATGIMLLFTIASQMMRLFAT